MQNETSCCTAGLVRCAVCKIDLKGRFVYVDDKIESLLGHTKEHLFGKELQNFLEVPSRELIKDLLAGRNHYETFYDSVRIILIDSQSRHVPARAVIWLNFIAGNPVNFQLVLDPEPPGQISSPDAGNVAYQVFLDEFMAQECMSLNRECLELIRQFTGAIRAAVYVVHGDSLEPRLGCTAENPDAFDFESIPDPGNVHRHVAATGCDYAFTDEACVRAAIENDGSAPDEYVTSLVLPDRGEYLLRLAFPENMSPEAAEGAVARARTVIGLLCRLSEKSVEEETAGDDVSVDIKFTVGFLDHLEIGAVLTESDGTIIGYNPCLAGFCGDDGPGENIADFLKILTACNRPGVAEKMNAVLCPPEDSPNLDDLHLPVVLPAGVEADLTMLRLSDDPGDQSACLVFIPHFQQPTDCSGVANNCRLWRSVMSALKAAQGRAAIGVEELENEVSQHLSESGAGVLNRMSEANRKLGDMLDDLAEMVRLLSNDEAVIAADLNELVNEAYEEVRRACGDIVFELRMEHLPTIGTQPGRLRTVFRNLFANAVSLSQGERVEVAVEVRVQDGFCWVTVADRGPGVSPHDLHHLFDLFHPGSDSAVLPPPGDGRTMGVTAELVRSIGGKISAGSKTGEGVRVTIVLPVGIVEEGQENDIADAVPARREQ